MNKVMTEEQQDMVVDCLADSRVAYLSCRECDFVEQIDGALSLSQAQAECLVKVMCG